MATQQDLIDALAPLLSDLAQMDHHAPGIAECLEGSWPIDGVEIQAIRALVVEGIQKGWFAPRGEEGMKWGRLAKSTEDTLSHSIDGVVMNGPGLAHTHPNGEIDLCFAIDGEPRFDGQPEGWVVYGPNTWHVPTVTGGTMAILYFLPDGAIQFGPRG